jgi:pyrimidine operon attenuation protein/uracil phosphoribosyltransferase
MGVLLWSEDRFQVTIERLARQLVERHENFDEQALIGLQPRGVFLARKLHRQLEKMLGKNSVPYGELDVTFYRDDFRRRNEPLVPAESAINFQVEAKQVILVDDVLFTGRTVRAGLDALHDYGRPARVEFLVLVDRRFSRHLPIDSDYVGIRVDTRLSQSVKVEWAEEEGADCIWLLDEE